MKYWNKNKDVRARCWTCIKLREDEYREPYFTGDYRGWKFWNDFEYTKALLQKLPSNGKFYMNIMKKEIWFEDAKDATWITLKYAEILR